MSRGTVKADIWCDGAARKKTSPGPAGAGFVILIPGKEPLHGSVPLGLATNNEAEYEAVLLALGAAAKRGVTKVHVRTDSSVVEGHYRKPSTAKAPHLKKRLARLQDLVSQFPGGVRLERIDRALNKEADKLARAARDMSSVR